MVAARVHAPFRTLYKLDHDVTLETKPVAPTALMASALNVPVNGAVPVDIAVTDAELIVVFWKPAVLELPSPFTRLRILPLGAFRLRIRSPSKLVLKLKLTAALVIVAPAGTPVTVRADEPKPLAGTETVMAPDDTEVGPTRPPVLTKRAAGLAGQRLAAAGFMASAEGLFPTATVSYTDAVHEPLDTV